MDHPLGVWFMTSTNPDYWSVFSQDFAAMPGYASFFLFIIPAEYIYLPSVIR
jgi:hypothetical protein